MAKVTALPSGQNRDMIPLRTALVEALVNVSCLCKNDILVLFQETNTKINLRKLSLLSFLKLY